MANSESFLTPSLCLPPSPRFPQGLGCHMCMSVDVTEETRKRESPALLNAHQCEDIASSSLTSFPADGSCDSDHNLAHYLAIPTE